MYDHSLMIAFIHEIVSTTTLSELVLLSSQQSHRWLSLVLISAYCLSLPVDVFEAVI